MEQQLNRNEMFMIVFTNDKEMTQKEYSDLRSSLIPPSSSQKAEHAFLRYSFHSHTFIMPL